MLAGFTCTMTSGDTPKYQAVWYQEVFPHRPTGFASLMTLPHSALGPSDRVIVKGGHFYRAGTGLAEPPASTSRIRFFGVNLALSANFPSEADGEKLAERLAALGINLVRIHAIDQPARERDVYPAGILVDASSPDLDRGAAQALKRFIAQLGAHGIYVDLNLHVNHTFPGGRSNDDIPPQSKPLQIFDEGMIRWQARYTKDLAAALDLRHTPGLAMMEIDNESTLIDNWQEGRLPDLVKGRYLEELASKWTQYEAAHNMPRRPLPVTPRGLDIEEIRSAAGFFVDLDRRYIGTLTSVIREQISETVPVSGTQVMHGGRWKHGGFLNFDIDRETSYIDAHFYVDHYWFPEQQWDWTNWRISNSWLGDVFESTLLNVAFARAADKPFVISEFNQPWPNQQASDLLPVVTQFAVSQDWDGLILYSYSHDKHWNVNTPSDFSLKGDWTKLAQIAQCAYYFRNIHPGTALPKAVLSLDPDDAIRAAAENISGAFSRYLAVRHNVRTLTATGRQIQMNVGRKFGIRQDSTPPSSSYLSYDAHARVIQFGSAYATGISGYMPIGRTFLSPAFDLTLLPRSRGFATAFLTSLDGAPLDSSSRLMLTLPGFTMGTSRTGPQQLSSGNLDSRWWTIASDIDPTRSANLYNVPGPSQMERIPARITIHAQNSGASVYALDSGGNRMATIAAQVDSHNVAFSLNTPDQPFAATYEIVLRH